MIRQVDKEAVALKEMRDEIRHVLSDNFMGVTLDNRVSRVMSVITKKLEARGYCIMEAMHD